MLLRRLASFVALAFAVGAAVDGRCVVSCWSAPAQSAETTCHRGPDGVRIGAADECGAAVLAPAPFLKVSRSLLICASTSDPAPSADRDSAVPPDLRSFVDIRPPDLHAAIPLRI